MAIPRNKLLEWLEIDVRSLAVLRILLSGILLVDLSVRAPWIEAHYTDAGVMPRGVMSSAHSFPGMWSLHALSGEMPLEVALFAAAAAAALMFGLGWQTRVATVASWVLLTSLHNRNIAILNTGDDLLRALLFWSMFLPLGAAWSLDARRRGTDPPRAIVHPAGAMMFLQVVLVYWVVVIRRHDLPQWFGRGNAVWTALMIDAYTTEIGIFIRDRMTWICKPLTWLAMIIEGFGPLLAFSPWRTGPARTAAVFVFVAMHVSFGLMMEIGLFWFVSCTSWAVFLPTWFWDAVGQRVAAVRLRFSVDRDSKAPVWLSTLAVLAMAVALLWNVRSLTQKEGYPLAFTKPLDPVGRAFRLDQGWNVYSPPGTTDGWFLAIGTLADGREVELRTGASPPTFDRPADIGDSYENQRWRRFLFPMNTPRRRWVMPTYSSWAARDWEKRHPGDEVRSVELVYMSCNTGRNKEKPVELNRLGTFQTPR